MKKKGGNGYMDMFYATKTSEVCAKIEACIDFGKSLEETIEYILSKYDGITEAYITEKIIRFLQNNIQ